MPPEPYEPYYTLKLCVAHFIRQHIFICMDGLGGGLRAHTPETIHHVMNRGSNRQRVFFGGEYFNYFLKILVDSEKKFNHKIIAYCLISSHENFIVHIHANILSTVMQSINFRYALY